MIFCFASAGASAAYLTVSDICPLEVRAQAIGGVVEALLGVNAEQKSLEDVAEPLSMVRRTSEALTGYGSGAVARRGVSSSLPPVS